MLWYLKAATADAYMKLHLTTVEPTADRTIRLPNVSGTLTIGGQIVVEDFKFSGLCYSR